MNGYYRFVPSTILLKCPSLKEFGVGSEKGTSKTMLYAAQTYDTKERLIKMLMCFRVDGASINFERDKKDLNGRAARVDVVFTVSIIIWKLQSKIATKKI